MALRAWVMLFGDVTFTTEGLSVIGVLVAALTTTIGVLHRHLMASKDAQLAEVKALCKTYEEIADEAIKSAVETTNWYRAKYEDKPPLIFQPPVIPESNSPPSTKQVEVAKAATMRADVVQLKAATKQTAGAPLVRHEGEPLVEALDAIKKDAREIVVMAEKAKHAVHEPKEDP